MPSLSGKAEPTVSTDAVEVSKNMVNMMEKKIRNLEKRKTRLEDYRTKQNRGQTLTDEQLKAVAKLEDVLSQIELLQDLTKQVNAHGSEVLKLQKKQQKRERFEQIENERKRFAELLHFQSVLNALGEEETRQAFAEGKEGAVKLEEQELNHLDELYKIINPERNAESSLEDQVKVSSEHLQFVLDGREKAVCGTTYKQLNDLITKIKNCPFFTEASKPAKEEAEAEVTETSTEKEFVVVETGEVPHTDSEEVQSALPPEIPVEAPMPTTEPVYQQEPDVMAQPSTDPSKTFEEIVENVQGRFNFIQDSEIDVDSPSHVDPAVVSVHQMPTQPFPAAHQPQRMVAHPQQPENSTYVQASNEPAAFPQYNVSSTASAANVAYGQADTPQPIPMPTAANTMTQQQSNQSMFAAQGESAQDEHPGKFTNGMTFESSALKQQQQQDKMHHSDDYQHRGQGQMRRGGGGHRGNRGGYSNGYNRGGYNRGGDRSAGGYRGDRQQGGGDRAHQPGNGFSDNRRGGRGSRSGGGNFQRGGPNSGRRGGYRGGNQQQAPPTNV